MYFITLPFLVRKILTFYINDVLLFKCPIPWLKGYSSQKFIKGIGLVFLKGQFISLISNNMIRFGTLRVCKSREFGLCLGRSVLGPR